MAEKNGPASRRFFLGFAVVGASKQYFIKIIIIIAFVGVVVYVLVFGFDFDFALIHSCVTYAHLEHLVHCM